MSRSHGDDWRITLVVCAAITLPAFAGMLARRWQGAIPVIAAMLSCSLIFFAATNFAVWAFGSLYPHSWQGLVQCYVAALPFLDKTVLGDLFWTAVLFGGAWLVQHVRRAVAARALAQHSLKPEPQGLEAADQIARPLGFGQP